MPEVFRQHIEEYGTGPAEFLSDNDFLRNKLINFSSDSFGDAFIAYYTYTLELKSRRKIDS